MAVMTRQALFEAAWERPLTDIAEDIGITSTGLKKICDRHDIPTPGRGYWAQVRAGKTFPRPKLRPAKSSALEEVVIVGARPLPPAVAAAIARAREASPPKPRTRRKAARVTPAELALASIPSPTGKGVAAEPEAKSSELGLEDLPKILEPTRKAIARARLSRDGFASVSGSRVVSLEVGEGAQVPALQFLAKLVEGAQARGWRLELTEAGSQLIVDGEAIRFRVEEQPTKTPHQPTDQELARKRERDRWGGDSQPWPTWDLSPSGRLALIIEGHTYDSGLRRTYSQRKGHTLADSLDAILVGFAAHAAMTLARRLEAQARAKAAALAEARRERIAAFKSREKRRAEFADAIGAGLAERARLQAVLDHLAAAPDAGEPGLGDMVAWLGRRIQAIEARIRPEALAISARHAEVGFCEPPKGEPASRWYAPKIELHLWIPAEEPGHVAGVSELEWAIAEGLVADPGAEPGAVGGEGDELAC